MSDCVECVEHIDLPAAVEICQFRSGVFGRFKASDYSLSISSSYLSPNGHDLYITKSNTIIVINLLNGTETSLQACSPEHKLIYRYFDDIVFLSDTTAFIIQNGYSNFIIRHVDFSEGNAIFSEPSPYKEITGNGSAYVYRSSCVDSDGTLISFVVGYGEHTGTIGHCLFFGYEDNKWIQPRKNFNFELNHDQNNNSESYSLYPTVYSGSLHAFYNWKAEPTNLWKNFKKYDRVCQYDLNSGKSTIIMAKNDLYCIEANKTIFNHCDVSINGKWVDSNLYLIINVESRLHLRKEPYYTYLATFNLNKLLWRPIQIKSLLTNEPYHIPLQLQISNNTLIGLEMKEVIDNKKKEIIGRSFYIPIPVGEPKKLERLAYFKVRSVYPKIELPSHIGLI